jgi:hypothetical protein
MDPNSPVPVVQQQEPASQESASSHPLQRSAFDGAGGGAGLNPPPFQLAQAAGGEGAAPEVQPAAAQEVVIPADLSGQVGPGKANNADDVRVVQTLLIRLGYLPATRADGSSNVTGICDTVTADAIGTMQTEIGGSTNPDKVVDPGGNSWKLLNGLPITATLSAATPEGQAPVRNEVFENIKTTFPNGVNMALYTHYADQNANNREFPRAAAEYANIYNSVAFTSAGVLQMGQEVPIRSLRDVTLAINDLHKILLHEHRKANPNAPADEIPAFTQIKTLTLFSHGMPYGVHLAENGRYNLRIDSEAEEAKFEGFVRGIRGSLKNDVDVALMACNTGRETDGTENNDIWYKSAADQQNGDTSFAARLAEELGEDASVYGHLSAGHTTNNYSARVFGADAGRDATQDQSGVHIFDLLYDAAFVTSEAERLGKERTAVYEWMLSHYKGRMNDSHHGRFSVTSGQGAQAQTEQIGLGSLMFTDIERAKTILRNDWASYGVTTYVR